MEKQEILEKSRKENQLCDEGILRAQEKGRQWGVVGFLALCAAVQVYHLALGLDNSLPLTSVRPWAGTGPGGRSTCWPSGAWGRWAPCSPWQAM